VAEIETMLRLKDIEFIRRANAHAKQWNEEVFERIQGQIDVGLREREAKGTYNTRWREAQDDYLRTLRKKEAGVFRDIVIEADYDPLENAGNNIKYSSKRVNQIDPLKTEMRNYAKEAKMVPGSKLALAAEKAAAHGLGRKCLPVRQWAQFEATPYGHFNRLVTREKPAQKGMPVSTTGMRVLGNHYERPKLPLEPERLY